MFQAIRDVLFGFMAVCCALIGFFWLWFMYAYSLKWLDADGEVVMGESTTVAFGADGASWIGLVAAGWLVLAVFFGLIQWRVRKNR